MKKSLLLGVTVFVTASLSFLSYQSSSKISGAPSGVANDPASGMTTCTDCHNGTASSVSGWITSNIPAGGYTPGQTYTITATVTSAGKTIFGFQVSPQNSSGTQKGSLIITSTSTTKVTGTKYVTHTSGGTAPSAPGSGTRSWSFNWVAPAAGTGAVTFYGAFLGGNNNGSESGDLTYKTTTTVNEASPCTVTANITSSADTLCPQDSATLTATGGVSYLWSNGATTATIKVPAGTYTVTATAAAGCTGSKSKTIVSRASVAPTGLNASNVFGVSVKIGWTKNTCATGYKIMYHPINTATWKTATVVDTNAKTISALTPLTTYEYKMASVYGTLISAYGAVKTFTTLCNCSLPALTVSVTSNTTTKISWIDESCSVRHKVQYRKLGATAWISKIVYDTTGVTNQILSGLTPNTTYQYRTRSECNLTGTFNSGWTGISTFATPLRLGSSLAEGFTIYPNPTEGIINLTGANAGTLRIFDMLGQQVFEQTFEASSETRTLDLSSLAKGMYLVQMQSEEGTFTDKIQIMK
jgi:hypothetical protein